MTRQLLPTDPRKPKRRKRKPPPKPPWLDAESYRLLVEMRSKLEAPSSTPTTMEVHHETAR